MESSNQRRWRQLDLWGWGRVRGSVRVREFDLKKKERENTGWICEKREKRLNNFFFNTFVCTEPNLSRYYSMSQIFDTFNISHEGVFLVFDVPNVKYLTFNTPDDNARCYIILLISFFLSLYPVPLSFCPSQASSLSFSPLSHTVQSKPCRLSTSPHHLTQASSFPSHHLSQLTPTAPPIKTEGMCRIDIFSTSKS